MATFLLNRSRTPVLLTLLTLAILCWPSQLSAQTLPELTAPVNDLANVIDAASRDELDRMIRALQQATGDVVVIATVETYAPYADIREFAVKLFENHGRGIGQAGKDNGALVVLA